MFPSTGRVGKGFRASECVAWQLHSLTDQELVRVKKKKERNSLPAIDVAFQTSFLVCTEAATKKGTSELTGTQSGGSRNKK